MHSHGGMRPQSWLRTNWVMVAGAALVVAQVVLRAWMLAGSWFQLDDFAFLSLIQNQPLRSYLFEPYAGHVMPGGFLLSWLNAQVDPLGWALPAAELVVMQAAASVGFLLLLRSAFGARPGILPPLGLYLFSVISLPAFVWWAAGVNQLPLQVAFAWGMLANLAYLRTRRFRFVVITLLVTGGSLAFYEKSLLLFGVYAIVALGYFATGDIVSRLRTVWRSYRRGVVAYGAVAGLYLVGYVTWGLNFDPNRANENPLGPVFSGMVVKSFGSGVLGGPLRWQANGELVSLPDPWELTVLVAWVVIAAVILELARTRKRSKRAWLLPGFLLAADVLLVAAGRSSFVGPSIALEYRYQTELAAAAALALGLSTLPLRGAVEKVEKVRDSAFFDRTWRVASATGAVLVLSLVSSLQYGIHWRSATQSRDYFASVAADLRASDAPLPLIDVAVPGYLLLAYRYPENTTSHVLRMFADHTQYVDHSTDSLYMIGDDGHVGPVVIPPERQALPGPAPCGYPVGESMVTIPLNGPVIGGGWWMRIGYIADGNSPVTVRVGENTYDTEVMQGLHSLYVAASGTFHQIVVSGLEGGTTMCVSDVTLGLPQPYVAAPDEDGSGGT